LLAPTDLVVAGCAVLVAWIGGRLATQAGFPAVLGELAAGVAMGPSLASFVVPSFAAWLATPAVGAIVGAISHAAVLLFMCRVGLELDLGLLGREASRVAGIATASLVVPFILGAFLAAGLYDDHRGPLESRVAFILFVGTAMSVTALPVLTRMLADLRAQHTLIGTIVTACAAVDDVAAWTVLGIVAALVAGSGNPVGGAVAIGLYLAVMLGLVRPALGWLHGRAPRRTVPWMVALALTAVGAVLGAEHVGLHAVFGAFLFGTAVPRAAGTHTWLDGPIGRVTGWLLPAFFVVMGLRTDLSALAGAGGLTLALVMGAACVGKVGAGAIAARLSSFPWREALVIGALLNTRGLVALVVVDLGRQLGILSPALFATFVVMAFATTALTVPVVRWLGWPGRAR
jgi:Kef-type K+ transport system membrane component KefB